ncbi:MAG: alpha/beta fold hydrolase [Acidobacteriota bacterium]
MTWRHCLAAAVVAALVSSAYVPAAQAQTPAKQGKWEKIKVHGKALEGNLEGDSPDRDVFVYLPASYASSRNRHYPVVYFLHGYGAHAETYWNSLSVAAASDAAASEMIMVLPDAYTLYDGSMFSNSPTTGDWETFIADDLVSYIDGHYRTIANRAARGLAGHSMGGYGTVRIGMKRPDAFGALYAMSSCCLFQDPTQTRPGQPAAGKQAPPAANTKGKQAGGGLAKAQQSQAAAWASNPQNPPTYFDLPTKDGEIQPLVAAKWIANSPLLMVDQYVPNLKRYRAIMIEVGTRDPFVTLNTQLEQALTRLGVQHKFETYDGDHGSGIKVRFAENLLPFFTANLTPAK